MSTAFAIFAGACCGCCFLMGLVVLLECREGDGLGQKADSATMQSSL